MITNYKKGILSEFIAMLLLIFCGYKILSRRFKCNLGEIDIIAKKHRAIIALEIKYRKNASVSSRSLSTKQLERIKKTLLYYTNKHKIKNTVLRIDFIYFSKDKIFPTHLKNITIN